MSKDFLNIKRILDLSALTLSQRLIRFTPVLPRAGKLRMVCSNSHYS